MDPSIPMGHQPLIALPHLAALGLGFDESGAFVGGTAVVSIAVVHLVLSMVYGAGGLMHSLLFSSDMQESSVPQARKFKLEWDNPDNQTFILGHHLIFFGVACIWFVEWARIHGIYDPAIGAIRQVEYDLNLSHIWDHQFDFLTIDSLEDVMGGHAFLAFLENSSCIACFSLVIYAKHSTAVNTLVLSNTFLKVVFSSGEKNLPYKLIYTPPYIRPAFFIPAVTNSLIS